jgi:hypothetical protein
LTERLYVDALPFDLSTYEIERVEMQEVAVDLDGGVEVRFSIRDMLVKLLA